MRRYRVFILVLFLWGNLFGSTPVPLKKLGLFPAVDAVPAEEAKRFFDSVESNGTFPDFFKENSHQHWFLYAIPAIKKDADYIIEIPDYQINDLRLYLIKEGEMQSEPILISGDELDPLEWTVLNRALHQLVTLKTGLNYRLLVQYSRPGNRPQLQINFHHLEDYFIYWAEVERRYGFLYGLIFIYVVLVFFLWIHSKNAMYFYLLIWVFVYLSYFFITSGHLKYLFQVHIPGLYSTIRVTLAFVGIYAMNAFTILHYQKQKELWWVKLIWNMLLLWMILLNSYNFITGENLYTGNEKQFILIVRFSVMCLLFIQLYLPIQHYRRFREITYLTYVMVFAGLNFIVYIYQTTIVEQLDFNQFMFITIWFLICEIIVIATGISIYTLSEQKKREILDTEMERLQLHARALQFEVQEKERKRIATELHDDILNRLSVMLWMLRDKITHNSSTKESIKQLSLDIKSYALGLYPQEVERQDIQSLIDENLVPIAQAKSIQLISEVDLSSQLTTIQKLHLFRLLQEFVRNTLNHSNARLIRLIVEEREGSIRIHLSDDGMGYDKVLTTSGLGMESIKNRVQILGGQLKITSEIGKGVQWDLHIPQN